MERPSPEDIKPDAELDVDDLDAVSDKRLTGPGAKAARQKAVPRTDTATLGREKRKR